MTQGSMAENSQPMVGARASPGSWPEWDLVSACDQLNNRRSDCERQGLVDRQSTLSSFLGNIVRDRPRVRR